VELGEGAERILLRGMIDRVDVEPMGRRAIVRDYKSGPGRPEHPAARWRSDHQLQVALYMLAVRELLSLEPVAGLYQPLGGSDMRARGVYLEGAPVGTLLAGTDARGEEELRAELEHASAHAVQLAARLRAGEVTPCPETCSRGGCRFPGICRAS
jgi:RecB family exonuclease